jgi:membrane protein implicated in regulation of membrane protease activity
MQEFRFQISGPRAGSRPGLVARMVYGLLAVVALAAAAFLGAFVFLAALGLFMIASLVLVVRVWWFRRQLERAAGAGTARGPAGRGPARPTDVIEGEYHVVDQEEAGEGRDGPRGER